MATERQDLVFYRYPSNKSYCELRRRLLRGKLVKRLGAAAAVSIPADDGMAIQTTVTRSEWLRGGR